MSDHDRLYGTVSTWISDAAFGFIKPDDGGADRFVHVTALRSGVNSLRSGQRVSFEPEVDRRTGKPRALNVELVG